ncbi:MAG: tetratricopeptide repeat protein [Candidatus Aceula meridiana]|nr:tetratricopeptide repeat protein [Candidatus Aceula meridiana]
MKILPPRRFILIVLFLFLFLFSSQTNVSAELLSFAEGAGEYRRKGLSAQRQGFFEQALHYYGEALAISPADPEIYNDIGIAYEQMGNVYEAERHYLMALRIDGSFLPVYSNLAYFYKKQGKFAKAIKFFKRRMELGKTRDPWVAEAAVELKELSEISPSVKKWLSDFEAQRLAQEMTKVNDQLLVEEKKAIVLKLTEEKRYMERARRYKEMKQYGRALIEYDEALSLDPQDISILELRHNVLLQMQKKEIQEHVSSALEKLESGDTESSKEEIRKILAIIPDE